MKQHNTYPRETNYDDIEQDEVELNEVNEEETYYGEDEERDILDDLNPDQLKELEESIEESERGETISIEECFENFDRWITESKRRRGLI